MCFTRKFRVTEADPPPDVKQAFAKYAKGGTHLTTNQLRRFLLEVQCEHQDDVPSAADNILQQILQKRHHIAKFTRNGLTLEDFHHYLFPADLNPPINYKVHQDMNAPLSHYFIFTGHNSYLTGNQLTSDCSDVPVIKALKKGVRVIELDIWTNSTKDDVHVLHGRTVTTPVELIRCLKSIRDHAFSASPYPVVITLEDHLTQTPDLQAKVAQDKYSQKNMQEKQRVSTESSRASFSSSSRSSSFSSIDCNRATQLSEHHCTFCSMSITEVHYQSQKEV